MHTTLNGWRKSRCPTQFIPPPHAFIYLISDIYRAGERVLQTKGTVGPKALRWEQAGYLPRSRRKAGVVGGGREKSS